MPKSFVVAATSVVAVALAPLALPADRGTAAAPAPPPSHTLTVSGTGVDMYPAYDPTVRRYAATTSEDTFPSDAEDNTSNEGASVTVHASTDDPDGYVLVDGVRMTGGQATITDVSGGREVSVIFVDSGGREADSVTVLPADFPRLTRTGTGAPTAGAVALTLSLWQPGSTWPQFNTVVDANGVPVWVQSVHEAGLDLKRQPDGHYSIATPSPAAGQLLDSRQVVELDDRFRPIASFHTVQPLTQTDGHDSILMAGGHRVLLAYQPNEVTGKTDAVIQEVDAAGHEVFRWDSSALAGETVRDGADYAHINSVAIVDGGEDFLASFRHLSSVLKIAREPHDGYRPGDVVWKLGGRDSTFSFVDDPFGGPCGQHAASQLPDDWGQPGEDVMVFDDGSTSGLGGALCVDPSAPQGPPVERLQSRVSIYHLDEEAGTATLVWSYGPESWFSWFMGSAQYLPASGHILVGWAAETRALATEVSPADGSVVWQLTADPSYVDGNDPRAYFSYRATELDAPDATPPVVEVTAPAARAVYAHGQAVRSSYSCRDQGGSTLQTCGDGPPGPALDTSTPGWHEYAVTASDGAGNTTTVTHRYRVLPAPVTARPDAMVRRPGGAWVGRRAYGGAAGQTARVTVRRGHARVLDVALVNRGTGPDRCLVAGARGTRAVPIAYTFDGRRVTGPVARGTWRTPRLAPGGRAVLRVVVRAAARASAGAHHRFLLRCGSSREPRVTDTVGMRVVTR